MENTNLRIILGIDISTTCTGVTLVSYDGENAKVLYIDRVKFKVPRKVKGTEALFVKSQQFIDKFLNHYKNYGITDIVIEEPLPNSQNLETVNTLMKFNGMLSQSVFQATNVIPRYISSYDARKYAFPELMAVRKYNKKGEVYDIKQIRKAFKHNDLVLFGSYPFDCKKKYILWNKVSELYPDIKWVYDKKGELKTENFDASDSLVCVLGYINKEKYLNTSGPNILSYKEDNILDSNNIIKFSYTTEFCGKTYEKILILD